MCLCSSSTVTKLSPQLGVDVRFAPTSAAAHLHDSLAHLHHEEVEQIKDAGVAMGGLWCFRFNEQPLSAEEQIRFTSLWGECEGSPGSGEEVKLDIPADCGAYIHPVGHPIGGHGFGELSWHTDMSYLPSPPTMSLLHCHTAPPGSAGGRTSFLSMAAVTRRLPAPLKARLRGLHLKHNAAHSSDGRLRKGYEEPATALEAPGAVHPMLRELPACRTEVLYLGRRHLAFIMGYSLQESEALLDELWSLTMQEDVVYTHEWEVGDALMWDNTVLIHHRDPFDSQCERLMWRTQTKGIPPQASYSRSS